MAVVGPNPSEGPDANYDYNADEGGRSMARTSITIVEGQAMIRDMGITEQCNVVHALVRSKGFWDHEKLHVQIDEIISALTKSSDGIYLDNPSIWAEKIALIQSEASEILEALRRDDIALEQEECADLLIRLMDYCGARGFDLGSAYVAKMAKNAERPHLHGRKF